MLLKQEKKKYMIKLKEQCRLFVLFSYYKIGDKVNIKFIDDLTLDIYIKKELIDNIDFNSKDDLEKYLKKLFKTLKNKYDLVIEGFYNITVYCDKYYGVIFHLEKDDIEYYDYFKNQVDMRIITVDTELLYLVDDILYNLLNKVNVIIKDNEIYLKIKEDLTELEMMELLESSKVVCKESLTNKI